MEKEEWFRAHAGHFVTNGYAKPPWKIYDQFLKVITGPGSILELGCGNGLLLRYLYDLARCRLLPYGVDLNAAAIHQAQTRIFPDRGACFIHADLRDGIPFSEQFDMILANPLYADQGYYEQLGGKIQRLYLDGSIEDLVRRCWQSLTPDGQLILWCYDGHVAEIAIYYTSFKSALAATGVRFKEIESGVVTFWVAERKSASRFH